MLYRSGEFVKGGKGSGIYPKNTTSAELPRRPWDASGVLRLLAAAPHPDILQILQEERQESKHHQTECPGKSNI